MALFNKFFSNKRKNLTTSTVQQNTSQFPFNKEQVRILLYRECDIRGRRLLFDSNAIQRVVFNNNNENNNSSNLNSHITNNNNTDNINNNDTIKNIHINGNYKSSSSTKQYNNNNCGSNGANASFIDVSDGFGYKYGRSTPDGGSIGEMVFGAVAMSFRGTSLKVHWLHSPSRILCSQVFLSPLETKMFSHNSNNNNNNNNTDTNYSDISSTETSSLSSFSLSVSVCVNDNLSGLGDVPTPELIESRLFACSGEDSGYSGGAGTGTGSSTDPWNASSSSFCPQSSTRSSFGSVYSDQDSFRKMSIDSSTTSELNANFNKTNDGNLQRRVLRNLSTSFENRASMSDYIGYISDNNNYQNHQVYGGSDSCVAKVRRNSETIENRSNPEMIRKKTSGDFMHHTSHGPYPARSNIRRAKLGLVIQITLSESREVEMQTFCSEHVALLESILCRLRTNAEKAYINRQNFFPLMLKAWRSTSLWITDLFTAPRIANPIWITLSSGNSKNPAALANNFMTELCGLLTYADTKDTRFFVSTLLTAILTHHLGWVGTVAPVSSQLNSSLSDIKKALRIKCWKMSEISKTHPYNALWAQMTDLYGAIGYPPKLSKTIVCGNDTNIIDKILNILTYFIRCGEIKRELNEKVIDKCTINNIMNSVSVGSFNKNSKIILNNNNSNTNNESVIDDTKNVCNSKKQIGGCLTRSTTCVKDLSEIQENNNKDNNNNSNSSYNNSNEINNNVSKTNNKIDIIFDTTDNTNFVNAFKKNIMNDIPNVLAYRDSRFVQQELRIGNHLMDTGILMDVKQKQEIKSYQIKNLNDNENNFNSNNINNKNFNSDIKVTITSPENYEFHVTHNVNKVLLNNNVQSSRVFMYNRSNNTNEYDKQSVSTASNNKQLDTDLRRTKSLHNKKETVKLTRKISVPKLEQFNDSNSNSDYINNLKLNIDNNTTNDNSNKIIKTCPSLGDLITANSVGQSERFLWGIEKVKEGISLEQKRHIELGEKIINKNDDVNNVVFVLGDNEELIGLKNTIKHNNEIDNNYNIYLNSKIIDKSNCGNCSESSSSSAGTGTNGNSASASPSTSMICKPAKYIKKETSEELVMDTTCPPQVLMNKKLCNRKFKKHSGVKFNFEQYPQIATNYMKNKNLDIANYNFLEKGLKMEREMKWNNGHCSSETIVTPDSIAEHDDDDNHECECCRGCEESHILQTPSNASELEYSNDITTDDQSNYPVQSPRSSFKVSPLLNEKDVVELSDNSEEESTMAVNKINEKQQELKINDKDTVLNLQIIEIPISKARDKVIKKSDNNDESKLALSKEQPGFTPSLFTGITDHYIPDMVLQGTIESPSNFEASLRHDLMLSSHCAIFEQTATENIAIIANTDKWDVHVVSSQSFVLPHGFGTQGSVGMSQLVASMLETVLVMWGAGTPAFQCMSYLEAKLQEMYLQSETLAAYLLGNDFCRLNTLTKALNLSENDVPLLLSVASIHSPQVCKKYGISFK